MSERLRRRIGQWGEKQVYAILKRAYPTAKVVWMNKTEESGIFVCACCNLLRNFVPGKPFDIQVNQNGKVIYVEVKSHIFHFESNNYERVSTFSNGQQVARPFSLELERTSFRCSEFKEV